MTYNSNLLSWSYHSDESTFYLDSPVGARWVKSKENYIHAKNKEKKSGHGLQLAREENITVFVWTKYEYSKLFKSIGRGYWRDEITQRYFNRFLIFLFKLTMQEIIG